MEAVINTVYYINNNKYRRTHRTHDYQCNRNFCSCIGWTRGQHNSNELVEKWLQVESEARRQPMEHIIETRGGKIDTSSTYFCYLMQEKDP